MFWGLIMEPNRRYTQQVKKSFHISMASMDVNLSDKEPAQVICGYDGRNYLLCTLRNPDILQCPLDLEFMEGAEVSFSCNGNSHVHLVGYITEVDEDTNSLSLADLEEEEEEEVQEEAGNEKPKKKKKKQKQNEPPAKKTKLLNGFGDAILNVSSEEDSDDSDFTAEEGETEENSDEDAEEEAEDEEVEDEEVEDEEVEEKVVQQPIKQKEKKKQNDSGEPKKKKNQKVEEKEKKPKQTLKHGIVIEDLVEGTGPVARPGRFVTVYYEGRLQKNNKMFDSSTKGPGFKFRLGAGEVIKGWDTGLVGMKVGGKRKIVCPPQAAYGAAGSPPAIPANSTLVFTVTLNKIK